MAQAYPKPVTEVDRGLRSQSRDTGAWQHGAAGGRRGRRGILAAMGTLPDHEPACHELFPKIPTDADEYVPYPELHR